MQGKRILGMNKRITAVITASALLTSPAVAESVRPGQAVPGVALAAAATQASSTQTADLPEGTREGPEAKKKKRRRLFGVIWWGAGAALLSGFAALGDGDTDASPSP